MPTLIKVSGKTPTRTIRVPTELWNRAKTKAYAEHRTITDVLVRMLKEYVGDTDDQES